MNSIINLPADTDPRVPAPATPYRHMVDLQMRFNDFDMLGHLNNGIYLAFFDLGKARYLEDSSQACAEAKADWRNPGVVVANINCDFIAPTYAGETIAVLTRVDTIGEKSLVMEQRIVNSATGQTKCICRTVMVGFDPATGHSAPISDDWRKAISTFEDRAL